MGVCVLGGEVGGGGKLNQAPLLDAFIFLSVFRLYCIYPKY